MEVTDNIQAPAQTSQASCAVSPHGRCCTTASDTIKGILTDVQFTMLMTLGL